jgi:hypothetical protein
MSKPIEKSESLYQYLLIDKLHSPILRFSSNWYALIVDSPKIITVKTEKLFDEMKTFLELMFEDAKKLRLQT